MRGKSKTGQLYFYYICRGRQAGICKLPYIRAIDVEHAVTAHYRTVGLTPEFRGKIKILFDQALSAQSGDDKQAKTLLKRRLTELERQEDRFIDAIADPDFPRSKITEKLRSIRDERARLQAQLEATTKELVAGHEVALRVLDYLDDPHALYEQSTPSQRVLLNRTFFNRLWVDRSDDGAALVTSDELTPPFATISCVHGRGV